MYKLTKLYRNADFICDKYTTDTLTQTKGSNCDKYTADTITQRYVIMNCGKYHTIAS